MAEALDATAPSGLLERATEVRADATRHLTSLAGDASMCAIGRSGRSFPAAKYHEGRQAAAGQCRRLLHQAGVDVDFDQGVAIVVGISSEWQRMLDDTAAKGPDWVAYASGGLDALTDIVEPRS